MEMRKKRLASLSALGFHRIAYVEWGDPDNTEVLVCVHGLTRNGRDFDDLANALSTRYRVVAPDVAGRGESDWLVDKQGYGYAQYLADLAALLARLDVEQVDYVGTSMGGILGMMLAAQPGNPIRKLVLNDVGSFIPSAALNRIAQYVGKDPVFEGVAELEKYLRMVNAGFGPLTDEQWAHLAAYSFRRDEAGKVRFRYDPAIGLAFENVPLPDIDLTLYWNPIRCPVLVIRGGDSGLLLPETVDEMCRSKPGTRSVEIPGVGHAPALMDDDQIALVKEFLI